MQLIFLLTPFEHYQGKCLMKFELAMELWLTHLKLHAKQIF